MVSASGRESMRVLVVEDERHIARLLQVNLERQGYAVVCAYDGRSAIRLLGEGEFDLALIDRGLPDMDGRDVLAWIRGNEATKDLRVVMMDRDGLPDDPSGPTAGANLWLTKPFNPARIFDL